MVRRGVNITPRVPLTPTTRLLGRCCGRHNGGRCVATWRAHLQSFCASLPPSLMHMSQELLPRLANVGFTSPDDTVLDADGDGSGESSPSVLMMRVLEQAVAVAWTVGNTTVTAWSSALQFVVALFLFLNLLCVAPAAWHCRLAAAVALTQARGRVAHRWQVLPTHAGA